MILLKLRGVCLDLYHGKLGHKDRWDTTWWMGKNTRLIGMKADQSSACPPGTPWRSASTKYPTSQCAPTQLTLSLLPSHRCHLGELFQALSVWDGHSMGREGCRIWYSNTSTGEQRCYSLLLLGGWQVLWTSQLRHKSADVHTSGK